MAEGLNGTRFGAADYRNTLKAYLDQNIYAFSAAKSLTMAEEFRNHLTDEKGNLVSFSEFKRKVAALDVKVNNGHLKAEYETAVSAAQMADKWETLKNFKTVQYTTVGDDRVSKEHAALDKLIIETNDPLLDKIYPPKRFRCRCSMLPGPDGEPVTDRAVIKEKAELMKTKPYFQKHVGKEKICFDDTRHPHFVSEGTKKVKIGELSAGKHYNMPSVDKIYERAKKLPELTHISETEANAWWKEKAPENKLALTGKDGISYEFTEKNFLKHLFKDNKRWNIVHHLPEMLENPDEIWCRRDNGKLYPTYLKWFDKHPMRLSYDMERDQWTMMELDRGEASLLNLENRLRRGQLKYRSR